MKFIFPTFLWTLLLVAIPLIIHLVNLRRHQTVYFSNVNFLKKVKKESQRRSKLKQLIMLICRIVVIMSLVIAFAKPYLPSTNIIKQLSNNVVCIYIDNSFSMNAEGEEGKAIESAKQKAFAIVDASPADAKYALLTNDLSEKHFRFYTKQEIKNIIGEVEEGKKAVKLTTILSRFENLTGNLLNDSDNKIFVISDFQKHTTDIINLKADTLSVYNFVKVPVNTIPNLYVDSCWFETPAHHLDQVEVLNVRIVNSSEEAYHQVSVNFFLNDSLKSLTTVDLSAKEEKTVTLQYTNLTTGIQNGKIEISDYPILYDNTIYFAYNVNDTQKALLIKPGSVSRNTGRFEAAFLKDPFVKLDIVNDNHLQISRLNEYSSIILYELMNFSTGLSVELKKYVENGGTLIIIPSIPGNIENYNSFLSDLRLPIITNFDSISIPIGEVDYSNPIYSGVFKPEGEKVTLPEINGRYKFSDFQKPDTSLVDQEVIIRFINKDNALISSVAGQGRVYVFAFQLSGEKNQFSNHILFFPTIYNMVLYSSSHQQLYSVLGKERFFTVKNPFDKLLQNPIIKEVATGNDIIPEVIQQEGNMLRLNIDDNLGAGFYKIYLEDEIIGGVALNYDLKESDLSYYTTDELKAFASQAGIKRFNVVDETASGFNIAINELDQGKQLWKIFVILALFSIVIEFLVIKFWDSFFNKKSEKKMI